MHIFFGLDPASDEADHLAHCWLSASDGAFVAHQSHPQRSVADLLGHLPDALIAVRRALG